MADPIWIRTDHEDRHDNAPLHQMDRARAYDSDEEAVHELRPGGGFAFDESGEPYKYVAPLPAR